MRTEGPDTHTPPQDGEKRRYVEFHISRESRDQYSIEDTIFSTRGHIAAGDFPAAQQLAQRINEKRRADIYPEERVTGAEVYVLGLIHEIFHYIIGQYIAQNGTALFSELYNTLNTSLGEEEVKRVFRGFIDRFPPTSVYRGALEADDFLEGDVEGTPATEIAEEELILLWVLNRNPAAERYRELFDDSTLAEETAYREYMAKSYLFFQKKPGMSGESLNLIEFLRAPAHAVPDDLMGQLEYIRDYWGELIGEWAHTLLTGIDLLREESRPRFGPGGPGPARELSFHGMGEEAEQFSEDTDWMPRVVLLAKSTFVWLDQLSKKYRRPINRLDEIPDEELDTIAGMGFTSLWLIGLWERSSASKTIKRSCGNPEAEASAYSLKRYEIAEELGGWEALAQLRERAWERGIRLASDMVPNHTGIDGDWVYDHPDRFLQLDSPPYPAYSYNSQNLSDDPSIGIYLEDHYYDRSDAALTFKRVHFDSGDTRYIYHGNDGTSMPWNDTAQLDYLNPETREAVIQTIIHVARNFSVIRFDAAMTLAKKHIQRLWYPQPGRGGDIPGRSIHGLPEEEFHRRMPAEFWREVVDRVAEEAPDTLLLAEAFWMMEGYFVRTLGMHRVYNSAFMNMLKEEENEKYKNTVKNTLSFDPEILKRFVNFMNNPDEETAIEQFGAGDKYLGICTLMVTMPGLPMFGHGQIEGLREKYGMEYRRAYWDEMPNDQLVEDHYRYIFPLIKRRRVFSGVNNFLLYDFYRDDGGVDHNVFAYSNRSGDDRAFVFYNNSYSSVSGRIHTSAPYMKKNADGSRETVENTLAEGLALQDGNDRFVVCREQRSGLQYLLPAEKIRGEGFHLDLRGFESRVYLDLYEVYDGDGLYRRLYHELGGRGSFDMERAKKELFLRPVHRALEPLLQGDLPTRISEILYGKAAKAGSSGTNKESPADLYRAFLEVCIELGYGSADKKEKALDRFSSQLKKADKLSGQEEKDAYYRRGLEIMREVPVVLLAYILLEPLSLFLSEESSYTGSAALAEDLLLPEQFFPLLKSRGAEEGSLTILHSLILAIAETAPVVSANLTRKESTSSAKGGTNSTKGNTDSAERGGNSAELLEKLLRSPYVSRHMQVNRHLDVEWFRGESFQELTWWIHLLSKMETPLENFPCFAQWLKAEEKAEYRLDLLMENI
ncbi:MAG: alpha-amylase family glycosyl hydrolase [Spirochaetaceae bacterium]